MPDREKVIRSLDALIQCAERIEQPCSTDCPYYGEEECGELGFDAMRDALTLLREQEPRVMTLEEIRMHEVYWAEQENVSRPWPIAMHHIRNAGLLDGPVYQDYMGDNYNTKEYGKTWRCWTARPTDEQRKAVKWDAGN